MPHKIYTVYLYGMIEQFLSFLRSIDKFTAEDAAVIEQYSQRRSVKEGEMLLKEGHTAKQLLFICAGVLKIVSVNEKGHDVVHFFLKRGQFCTMLHSFTNNVPANEGIVAACDAELIVLNKDALQNIYAKVPHLQTLIETVTHKGLVDKIAIKNSYNGKDATERYKTFLHLQPEIAQQAALGDIASYLGITIQSLSRIRKKYK